jgi:hypothetical protein
MYLKVRLHKNYLVLGLRWCHKMLMKMKYLKNKKKLTKNKNNKNKLIKNKK